MTTHAPAEATSYVNPHHTLSEEAQESLRALAEADRIAFERRAEAEQRGRPTEEERAQVADMWSTVARSIGVDVDMVRQTLGDVRDRRAQRAAGEDRTFAGETTEVVQREPMVFDAPEPIDHSFWAATFNFGGDGEFRGSFQSNGLLITGSIVHHTGNLRHAQFFARGTYGISPDRIPDSPHNRWRSTPFIELFGGVEAHTGDDDIFTGDLWSKCWMHRKQTLFQPTFGGTIAVGQREEVQTLIFEENADRTVRWAAPGFMSMPNLDFGPIRRDLQLFSVVESVFAIQIEGAGSVLQLNPNLLYRGFQWPMQPL